MSNMALTEIEIIQYLLSKEEEGKKMKGSIRPISRQASCPKCGNKFKHITKLGYVCPDCKTTPMRFYLDIHWNGQRPRICSDKLGQSLDTYERAQNMLAHIQYEIDNHTFDPARYVAADIKKFRFENVIRKWIKEKEQEAEKGFLSWSYIRPMQGHINNYIIPFFKTKDIRDIRTVDIKDFVRQLPDRLSPKTRKNILDELRNCFNSLIEDEIITKKPSFPKMTVPDPDIKWCRRDLQDKILNAIPEKHRPIFFFLTRQGIRPGEAIALKWGDIDRGNGILTVKRTVSDRRIVERTKSKKIRARLLHPDILDILASIPRGLPHTYLFPNPNTGRPYGPDTLQRIWKKAAKAAGTDISLYQATRHSVASMAATSGVSIQIIKEVLGHTDIRTTQKYAHLDVIAQSQVFSAQEQERSEKKVVKKLK
jgi:integrase